MHVREGVEVQSFRSCFSEVMKSYNCFKSNGPPVRESGKTAASTCPCSRQSAFGVMAPALGSQGRKLPESTNRLKWQTQYATQSSKRIQRSGVCKSNLTQIAPTRRTAETNKAMQCRIAFAPCVSASALRVLHTIVRTRLWRCAC